MIQFLAFKNYKLIIGIVILVILSVFLYQFKLGLDARKMIPLLKTEIIRQQEEKKTVIKNFSDESKRIIEQSNIKVTAEELKNESKNDVGSNAVAISVRAAKRINQVR